MNADGTVDNSFVYGGGFASGYADILTLQPTGEIVVTGLFNSYNGTAANSIIRLNPDGSVDASLVSGAGFNGHVRDTKIQPGGKLLVGGSFSTYNGTAASRIVRLNNDGSIDGSFVYGSGFDTHVTSLLIYPDGKILAGGDFTHLV